MNNLLDAVIRRIPDFPKPGVLFYDVTGILRDVKAFRFCIDEMVRLYSGAKIDAVAAVESRGFVFASPFAERLGVPLVLIRKKGKLPGDTFSAEYSLEYGTATIEMHKSDVKAGQRVLVVDDLIATGGTLKAARVLVEKAGGIVAGFFGVIGLSFFDYKSALAPAEVRTLIDFDKE